MIRFKDVSIRSKVLLMVCMTLLFQVFIALTGLYYLNQTNGNLEADRMDLQLGRVRVRDLADGVRTPFQHVAEEKGLGLEVVVVEDAPGEIVSDRKRIEQVVRNLISNALKGHQARWGQVARRFPAEASRPDRGRP